MITIVTGKINSSKTTKITEIYQSINKGDGFVSIKNMDKDIVHSYDALRLSTNQKKQLVVRDTYCTKDYEKCCQIGPYLFNKEVVTEIEDTFAELIKKRIEPLFLDEIGLLELEDLCFNDILKTLIQSDLDIYFTVRSNLLQEVIEKYNILEYKLIEV